MQMLPGMRCALLGRLELPASCDGLQPEVLMCGVDPAEALAYLERLERATEPR